MIRNTTVVKCLLLSTAYFYLFTPTLWSESTNYKSGISVVFLGEQGFNWEEENLWYDPIEDDAKVVYLRGDTQIQMSHNERNIQQITGDTIEVIGVNGKDSIPLSGDEGIIRYSLDRDYQHGFFHKWSSGVFNRLAITSIEDIPTQNRARIRFANTQETLSNYFTVGEVLIVRESSHNDGTYAVTQIDNTGKSVQVSVSAVNELTPQSAYAYGISTYPAYEKPFSLSDLTYGTGYVGDFSTVPVLGSVGNNGIDINDRINHYQYGQLDEFGDEWHTLTVADDDEHVTTAGTREKASDSKVIMLIVNPKTPALRLIAEEGGQYYTTPPKVFGVPKIHRQISYISNNVSLVLSNIVNDAPCFYRFYSGTPTGSFFQFSKNAMAASIAKLSDGVEYQLEYYYNPNYIKTRTIIKNPAYPSDGESHGNMLWKDTDEFIEIKSRLAPNYQAYCQGINGRSYNWWYELLKQPSNLKTRNYQTAWDEIYHTGSRSVHSGYAAFTNAFIALIEGMEYSYPGSKKSYARYAKEMLLDSVLNLTIVGFGDQIAANPTQELFYRGYWDVEPTIGGALAYDLLIAHYKAASVEGGITSIEDYKIRDSLASWNMMCLMQMGGYGKETNRGMWCVSRNMGALVVANAIPSYNTHYYGTSGFDNSNATFHYTPYPDHPVTWKEAFFSETNPLYGFPNQQVRFDEDVYLGGDYGPIILENTYTFNGKTWQQGDFANRAPYMARALMGMPFQLTANVMKILHNHSYPYWEDMFKKISTPVIAGKYGLGSLRYGECLNTCYFNIINKHFIDNDIAVTAERHMTYTPIRAESYSNTTAFDTLSKQIRRTGESFISLGFKSGMKVSVSGSRFNDGIYTLQDVQDTYLTVKESLNTESSRNSTYIHSFYAFLNSQVVLLKNNRIEFQTEPDLSAYEVGTLIRIFGETDNKRYYTITEVGKTYIAVNKSFDNEDNVIVDVLGYYPRNGEPAGDNAHINNQFSANGVFGLILYHDNWRDFGNKDNYDATSSFYYLSTAAENGSVTKRVNGVVTTATSFAQGTVVQLTATANNGYTFSTWSGNATGTVNSVTLTMDGNKVITATFDPDPNSANIDPVAHWLFDEPYQSTAIDIISGQTASLINDPNWGEAWAREHLIRLDSGIQAMQVPMNNCRPENGSIALRIQPENIDSIQILFGHALDSVDNRIALYLAAGNLALGIGDTLQSNICLLAPNQSYHVAVTWDGTDYAVFVDGAQKTSGVFNGLSRLDATADVGNYGMSENRASGIGFRGLVEDVQLYSYALTTEAIQTLSLTHYVRENRIVEFIVGGYDLQGNTITYTAQNLPQGATFDVATQTFSWRPALYKSAGRYQITFTGADQSDRIATISVLDATLAEWYRSFLDSVDKD